MTQIGDPGGWLWLVYYGAVGAALVALGFESRLSRTGTVFGCLLLMGGLAACLALAPSVYRLIADLLTRDIRITSTGDPGVESLGPLIAAAMLITALVLRRRRAHRDA